MRVCVDFTSIGIHRQHPYVVVTPARPSPTIEVKVVGEGYVKPCRGSVIVKIEVTRRAGGIIEDIILDYSGVCTVLLEGYRASCLYPSMNRGVVIESVVVD